MMAMPPQGSGPVSGGAAGGTSWKYFSRMSFAKFGVGIAEVGRLLNELEQNLENAKLSLKRGFIPDFTQSSG